MGFVVTQHPSTMCKQKQVHIRTVIAWTFVAGGQITNIRLETVDNHGNSSGAVLVEYDDVYVSVCYDGDTHLWDKRSAIVACRQLRYKGGWPIMIQDDSKGNQYTYLQDFDCGCK